MVMRIGVSSVFAAAFFVAAAAPAESDGKATVVIQGRGRDVSIVYRAPRSSAPDRPGAADPLAEALSRKKNGADDTALVDYLSQNEAALPDVVDASRLRALRRAGAGDSVIAAISSFAAVDIGRTAEETGPPAPTDESAGDAGAYPDLANMGYPFYGGGYGGGFYGGGWFGARVRHHGSRIFHGHDVFHFRLTPPHFRQPVFGNPRPVPHGGRGGSMSGRMR